MKSISPEALQGMAKSAGGRFVWVCVEGIRTCPDTKHGLGSAGVFPVNQPNKKCLLKKHTQMLQILSWCRTCILRGW